MQMEMDVHEGEATLTDYPMQAMRWLRHDFLLVPIYMGFYLVDTFFCISGLIAYRALKLKFSEKKVGEQDSPAIVKSLMS